MHRILRAAGIGKRRAAQTDRRGIRVDIGGKQIARRARATPNVLLGGVANGRLAREYLHDAIGARARLGEHDHEIGHVHDGEQGLRHVVHERHDLPLRKGARLDLKAAHPQDGAHGEVHHKKRCRVEHAGQTPHGDRGVRLAERRVGKTAPLVFLAHERADDARAGQPLARDQPDLVELPLHAPKVRDATRHDEPEDRADERCRYQEDQTELHIDEQGRHHGTQGQERKARELADRQGDGELHLVDVVGDARDERRRAKSVELGKGERVDVGEQRVAHAGAQSLRGASGHFLADERGGEARERHDHEQGAVHQEGLDVALTHAAVDHERDDEGRKQVEHDLDELARRTERELATKGSAKPFEQFDHTGPSQSTGPFAREQRPLTPKRSHCTLVSAPRRIAARQVCTCRPVIERTLGMSPHEPKKPRGKAISAEWLSKRKGYRHRKTPRVLDGNGCPAEAPYGCFLPDLTRFGTYRHPNPSNARGVFDYSSRLSHARPA